MTGQHKLVVIRKDEFMKLWGKRKRLNYFRLVRVLLKESRLIPKSRCDISN